MKRQSVIVLFCLLCDVLLIVAKQRDSLPVHWIVIHYHKTGNFLSTTLTKPFEALNVSIYADDVHKRKAFEPFYFTKSLSDTVYPIIISRASNFLFDWNKVLLNNNKVQYRVAHMVRDPYDMVLSGFLYHSQTKMPEGWLANKINPCLANNHDIHQFLSTISQHPCGPNFKTLQQYVRNITSVCQRIHREFSTNNYYRTLRSMIARGFRSEALQMEASRTLLSGVW
jgi:hypothetical protein